MARVEREFPGVRLPSGLWAEIRPDRFRPGAFELTVDGTPQSVVDPDDPTMLAFEYVQRMGVVIDQLPDGPLTAVHLGAGGLTLPRYLAATHPGSRQQVLELERDLVELVRRELPLPRDAGIRIRYGDARDLLERLPAALDGAVDVLVVDVFGGSRIPRHVTSVEFYRSVAARLAPTGIVLVNVADGSRLAFARSQAATLRAALADDDGTSHVAVLADAQLLKGRRFGNVVLVGSPSPLPIEWVPRLLAGGPLPAQLLEGTALTNWIAGAPVSTDETAGASPSFWDTIVDLVPRDDGPPPPGSDA